MGEGLLSLKWNNHRSTFTHVLSNLRQKELHTDATLACEGEFFPVHKLVLSMCSDYFSKAFERTTCKSPVIILKGIKSKELVKLLDYMYMGEVDVRQNDLASLIKVAECLEIKGLAVPDDDPLVRNSKVSESQSKTTTSPTPKKRRHSSEKLSVEEEVTEKPSNDVSDPDIDARPQSVLFPAETIKLEDEDKAGTPSFQDSCVKFEMNPASKLENYSENFSMIAKMEQDDSNAGPSSLHDDNSTEWGDDLDSNSAQENYPSEQPRVIGDLRLIPLRRPSVIPATCHICHATISNRSNLPRHMRTHTGEKPYACEHCSYRTSEKYNLSAHIKTQHLGKLTCPLCDHRSIDLRELESHFLHKHGN